MAVDGEGVEKTGPGEEGVVAGGNYRSHDHGVDEASGCFGAGHLEDESEG